MAITHSPAEQTHWQPEQTNIVDGRPVRFSDVCVHEFTVDCDVDDPVLYVGEPLLAWQNSESGQWVMEHAAEQPYWIKNLDVHLYIYQVRVMARLSEQNQTFFQLKWGKQ
jgi:hypothetical protein